jgi:hypothetical protein
MAKMTLEIKTYPHTENELSQLEKQVVTLRKTGMSTMLDIPIPNSVTCPKHEIPEPLIEPIGQQCNCPKGGAGRKRWCAEQERLKAKKTRRWLWTISFPCRCCGIEVFQWGYRQSHKLCFDCNNVRIKQYQAEWRAANIPKAAEVSCDQCGIVFQPKRKTAKFCSSKCRVTAHRAKQSLEGGSDG